MLLAHKAELGIKRISRVTVVTSEAKERSRFGEKPRKDLHLFFGIEDVPPDKITGPKSIDTQRSRRGNLPTGEMRGQSRVVYVKKKDMLREHIVRFEEQPIRSAGPCPLSLHGPLSYD